MSKFGKTGLALSMSQASQLRLENQKLFLYISEFVYLFKNGSFVIIPDRVIRILRYECILERFLSSIENVTFIMY